MAKKEAAAPAAKEVKASKVSRGVTAKEDTAERAARARKYPDTLRLKVLNKENPHKQTKRSEDGKGRRAAFDAMLGCKTMGDYYATGHKVKYIQGWIESGHLADFADA